MLNKNLKTDFIGGLVQSRPLLYASAQQIKDFNCWLEIDKKKFFKNIEWVKKFIGPQVRIAAVLKSNAYGHGLELIATLCEEHTLIDYMVVFLLSDALKIRALNIKKPILVLGGYDATLELAVEHNIDLVVHDWESAHMIYACAQKSKKPVNIHLKIDTGLSRLGFLPQEIPALIDYLLQNPFINIVGVYTHFSESDAPDTTFTHVQMEQFKEVVLYLRTKRGLKLPIVHTANTAAAMRFKQAHWNFIRCGGALYGSYKDACFYQDVAQAVPGFALSTVLTLKARIMTIRQIPAGTPVGYGRSFIAKEPLRLAVVSVGYYNDYDRRLSNNGSMIVHNTCVPIVGRVGMNMTTIDVSSVAAAHVGDEVTVIGDCEGVRLKDFAHLMNVTYEVMPPLTPAIPRVIVNT